MAIHRPVRFAVYIPVGPSDLDPNRLEDLLASLYAYEPDVSLIILADHGPYQRDFIPLLARFGATPCTIVKHVVQAHNATWLGAGCVANLQALNCILPTFDIEFLLKIDTDALIIAPFADVIANHFKERPEVGIAGTLGNTCNRNTRTLRYDHASRAICRELVRVGKQLETRSALDNAQVRYWNLFTEEQRESFRLVANEIGIIEHSDFDGSHCQGGAYAISSGLMRALRGRQALDNPERWLWIPLAEDRFMGLQCSLSGMTLSDFSGCCEPFGIQCQGLAYPPQELVTRGHSIIHSLRSDSSLSEGLIRDFFRARRTREGGLRPISGRVASDNEARFP